MSVLVFVFFVSQQWPNGIFSSIWIIIILIPPNDDDDGNESIKDSFRKRTKCMPESRNWLFSLISFWMILLGFLILFHSFCAFVPHIFYLICFTMLQSILCSFFLNRSANRHFSLFIFRILSPMYNSPHIFSPAESVSSDQSKNETKKKIENEIWW